jgi:Mn-dependent DtxR family transcriptional regulator
LLILFGCGYAALGKSLTKANCTVRAIPEVDENPPMAPEYTPHQDRYFAFIYYYTKIHGVPPAEADMQRYVRVSPPAVHEMVMALERHGFISREPGKPRSIRLLLCRAELPDLE